MFVAVLVAGADGPDEDDVVVEGAAVVTESPGEHPAATTAMTAKTPIMDLHRIRVSVPPVAYRPTCSVRHVTELLHPNAAPFRFEADGRDELVFLHGWTGSPAHLRPIAEVVAAAGFPVTAPLLAGHGTDETDMVHTGWRDWLRSAAEAAQDVVDRGNRVHLAGLSMGGVLALLLAPSFEAGSVTTINAPLRVRSWQFHLSPLLRGSHTVQILTEDDPAPAGMEEFWHQYDDRPVGTVAELRDLVRATRENLGRVTSPILVIQSRTDETVRPTSATEIFEGVASRRKRHLWLHRSRHVSTLDGEWHIIASAMVEHLRSSSDETAI